MLAEIIPVEERETRDMSATVRAAQAGDVDAFTVLMRAYSGYALALAARRLPDRGLAEDVAQEAWIEAYACLPHLREPAAFGAWLRQIVLKQVDRVTRRHGLALTSLDDQIGELAAPEQPADRIEADERHSFLATMLARLPSATRDVMELFYFGDLSHAQVAAALGIPITTVKKRLHDGRNALRRALTIQSIDEAVMSDGPMPSGLLARVLFFVALASGDVAAVRSALRRHPDLVDAREEWRESLASLYALGTAARYTGLHRAAALGNPAMVRCLIDAGADVNARASLEQTPLHVAILNGWSAVAALLVGAGAHLDAPTSSGMTALHWATLHADAPCIRLLLTAGATTDASDHLGRTPRDWARLKGCEHLFAGRG